MSNALKKNKSTPEDQLITSVDNYLASVVEELNIVAPLKKAIEYSVLNGGKRLRPVLALNIAEDLGCNPSSILPAAAALEFLHAASLVHDDLPTMDDDSLRRGKPACHIQFGEATALLCGDILPTLAFTSVANVNLEDEQKFRIINILSEAYRNLCNGQQLDILPDKSLSELSIIHKV